MFCRTGFNALLLLMTGLLVGCSSSSESEPLPCNPILAVATGGLSCVFETALGTGPTSDQPPPPPPLGASSPLISREAFDVEPNNDISTPSATTFPAPLTPDQSVGFHVNGTYNNMTDGVDTYAFTATRARNFVFQLCASSAAADCNLISPDGKLDVDIAYISVLDQFGTVLVSSQGNTLAGNVQQMPVDAGVLYHVMVLTEDTMNTDQTYYLRVYESTTS